MKRKRIPWSLLGSATLGLFLSGLILRSVLAGPPTVPRANDLTVAERVTQPSRGHDERVTIPPGELVAGNGLVEPAQREVKVAGEVPGRIDSIAVKEGDFVPAGAELLRLASASEAAALSAAEADLLAAKADYVRTTRGQRHEDIDAAIADAEAAQSRSELSLGVLARNEQLAKDGAVTTDELDRLRRQAASDRSLFKLSDARRRAAVSGSRGEDIAVARARVQAAAARRNQARALLDRLTVHAPIGGEILQIKYRVGEYYSPNNPDPLLTLGDTRQLRVRMDVDERDVGKLRLGAKAFVVADAFPTIKFPGEVVEIGRRMGRKNIRTDDPTERIDTKILEVVIGIGHPPQLIPGLRVVSYLTAPLPSSP
jgi:multidrug resistance efflux pump